MEYRHLGRSGLRVSALSFGSWVTFGDQYGTDTALACMQAAYDAGVNFFDNAEAYAEGKSETIMGEVINKTGWQRSDLVIATKIFWGGKGPNDRGLSRKHIIEGMFALAGAAGAGLRRPGLLPPARPAHAHRGDRAGHERRGHQRQGLLLGHQRVDGRADPPCPRLRHPHRPRAAHHGAAAVQHAHPRAGGGGVRAAVPRLRSGNHDLVAARQRHPDRQVQRRHPSRQPPRPREVRLAQAHRRGRRGDRASWRWRAGWPRWPRIWAAPPRSWPWPGA